MRYKKGMRALAIAAALAAGGAGAAPTVYFAAPRDEATVSGTLGGSACEARGGGIRRVQFYLGSTALNSDTKSPWNCSLDTRRFADGRYVLRAVAYDAQGTSRSTQVDLNIRNGASAPTLSFLAPASGGTLIGNYNNSDRCEVAGEGISKVDFYLNATRLNTDTAARWQCGFDSKAFPNGPYTLKAVAYNAAGVSTAVQIPVTVENTVANNPPELTLLAPAAGATLSGYVSGSGCEASATDADGGVRQVDFYLGDRLLGSKTAAPYQCAVDTKAFTDGAYTFTVVATDTLGKTASVQRTVNVSNVAAVDAADIVHQAQAGVPFTEQSGYNTQVINTYLSAPQIPETGVNGTVLPNGETLRLGKQPDPLNSTKKALTFQLHYDDPTTSGSKRSEIKFPAVVEMNKVYWAAFSIYTYDWGSLPSAENAVFGMQLHAGSTTYGLSPAISIVAGRGGYSWWVDARTSTANPPSQSTSYSVRSADQPIRFGRWMDVVLKFKLNTGGAGFVQAWVDGALIFDHTGSIGYNTGTEKPYFKFGYYNWNSFSGVRKVLLRSPVVVADPTGDKYTHEALRHFLVDR